jgi:hypothetical protein
MALDLTQAKTALATLVSGSYTTTENRAANDDLWATAA